MILQETLCFPSQLHRYHHRPNRHLGTRKVNSLASTSTIWTWFPMVSFEFLWFPVDFSHQSWLHAWLVQIHSKIQRAATSCPASCDSETFGRRAKFRPASFRLQGSQNAMALWIWSPPRWKLSEWMLKWMQLGESQQDNFMEDRRIFLEDREKHQGTWKHQEFRAAVTHLDDLLLWCLCPLPL